MLFRSKEAEQECEQEAEEEIETDTIGLGQDGTAGQSANPFDVLFEDDGDLPF